MPILFDEIPELDVEPERRGWCDQCQRRTLYRWDAFDYRECLEHTQEIEECHE